MRKMLRSASVGKKGFLLERKSVTHAKATSAEDCVNSVVDADVDAGAVINVNTDSHGDADGIAITDSACVQMMSMLMGMESSEDVVYHTADDADGNGNGNSITKGQSCQVLQFSVQSSAPSR